MSQTVPPLDTLLRLVHVRLRKAAFSYCGGHFSLKAEERNGTRVCPVCKQKFASDVSTCPTDFILLAEIDPFIGQTINDEFVVESYIGQGGMSKVYLGRQTKLDRPVAIKVLKSLGPKANIALKRMQREAVIVGQLNHRNIAKIYSSGVTEEGRFFLIMEFIDGKNLFQLAESDGLDPRRCFEILFQLAEALQYAHSKGVVHRDVKPTNIVLCKDSSGNEITKLIDFGHAWHVILSQDSRLTGPGEVLGTPTFMAPEQLRGGEPDVRWDIFAFGSVTRMLLDSEGLVPLLCKELIDRCLQENMELRYQSMAEVIEELNKIRSADSTEVPAMVVASQPHTDSNKKQKRWPLVAALAATSLVLVLIAVVYCYCTDDYLAMALNAGVNAGVIRARAQSGNSLAAIDEQTSKWLLSSDRSIAAQKYLAQRIDGYRSHHRSPLMAMAQHQLTLVELAQKDDINARKLRVDAAENYVKAIDAVWRAQQFEAMSNLIQRYYQLTELDVLNEFDKTHGLAREEERDFVYHARFLILQYYATLPLAPLLDVNILVDCLESTLAQHAAKHERAFTLGHVEKIQSFLQAGKRVDEAEKIINKAIALESKMKDPCLPEMQVLSNRLIDLRIGKIAKRANNYLAQQKFADAAACYVQNAELAEQSTEPMKWRSVTHWLTKQAIMLRQMQSLDDADKVLMKALAVNLGHTSEFEPNRAQMSNIFLEKALVASTRGSYYVADKYYLEAFTQAEKIQNLEARTIQKAQVIYHRARNARVAGDYDRAVQLYQQGIDLVSTLSDKTKWAGLKQSRDERAELIKRSLIKRSQQNKDLPDKSSTHQSR